MQYGLQMYSLRDIPREREEESFAAAAKAGYTMVELCNDYTVDDCEKLAGYLKKYKLKPISAHVNFDELRDHYHRIAPLYRDLGVRDLIVARSFDDKRAIDEFIDQVNRLQKRLDRDGLRLGYHNHSGEFRATWDNIIPYPELIRRTDMHFELDTYWSFHAGMDSVRMMEQMRDRIKFVHLKDGSFDGESYCAVGEGEAPVEAVRAKAIALGMTIIVENECLTPSGVDVITRGINYLRRLDEIDGK